MYAPAARLGLIAVWDDGDPLLAEPLAPGVHPRDAALVRQEQSGAALLFAAHTRSVEVERLVEIGWVHAIEPAGQVRPKVVLTEQQASPEPGSARIPSSAWRQAQEAVREGPVLVQVARPGNAPLLAVLWALYLSFTHVGQIFYGYGWDSLLCEAGFLAIFLAPAWRPGELAPGNAPPVIVVSRSVRSLETPCQSGWHGVGTVLVRLCGDGFMWSVLLAVGFAECAAREWSARRSVRRGSAAGPVRS